MALGNLLESYISSIDSISSSLDGVNDHLYHEMYSEINEFYKIHDDSHSANEYIEKNLFTEDYAAINDSLLSKCKDCYASLEQYRVQEGQSIEGYKKIVSVASNKRLKVILAEYEHKIEQVKDCQKEIAECKLLLNKCEIELSKNNLLEKNTEVNSLKEYLQSLEGLTLSSVDEFIKGSDVKKLRKSRQSLENLLESSQSFEKSLREYKKSKLDLENDLANKKIVLSKFV